MTNTRMTNFISAASLVLFYAIVVGTRFVRDVAIPGTFLAYQLTRIMVATLISFVRVQRGTVEETPSPLLDGLSEILVDYKPTRYDRIDDGALDIEAEAAMRLKMAEAIEARRVTNQEVVMTSPIEDLKVSQEVVLSALAKKPAKKRAPRAKVSIQHDGIMVDVAELLVDSQYAME